MFLKKWLARRVLRKNGYCPIHVIPLSDVRGAFNLFCPKCEVTKRTLQDAKCEASLTKALETLR